MTISVSAGTLSVPIVTQGTYTSACWAACGAATCQYYGSAVSMSVFANTCGKTLSQSATMSEIQYGLANYSVPTTYYPQSSSFSTNTTLAKLQAEIDAADPIVADVVAHVVIIRGYSGSTLSIMDPMYSSYVSVPYSGFYASSGNYYGYNFNSALFT